jgi:NAD(P)-dependent dehydrogenase (short-subunit alcohol dehydrogenase family)
MRKYVEISSFLGFVAVAACSGKSGGSGFEDDGGTSDQTDGGTPVIGADGSTPGFNGDGGTAAPPDGSVTITTTIYANTDDSLYSMDPSTRAVTLIGKFAALDLAPFGIRVNAVEPGVVKTSFAAFVTEDPVAAPEYLKKIPLNRFAEPADVANAILFLASPEADYITGQALVIDGGLTLGLPLADVQFGSAKPAKKSSRVKRKNARTQ